MNSKPDISPAPRVHPMSIRPQFIASLGVFAVLVILLWHIWENSRFRLLGLRADQLHHGREIYLALRNYAEDMRERGTLPTHVNEDPRKPLFTNSNEALQTLISHYIVDRDKRAFFHRRSTWCRPRAESEANRDILEPGDNDWCYIRGLRADSPADWPILANAFAPGTTGYVKNPQQPGGVFRGNFAIVIHVGGAALIVDTKYKRPHFVVPRKDKPASNAFEKDTDWLIGENVQLLYPLDPTSPPLLGKPVL